MIVHQNDPPKKKIGILGGGQLGQMLTLAAHDLNLEVHVLDPDPNCPAFHFADVKYTAAYDDLKVIEQFARGVNIVSFEFENVPAQSLAMIENLRPAYPSSKVLSTTQHRVREKNFIKGLGIPTAPFRPILTLGDLVSGVHDLGTPCILKTAVMGYDGKGQQRINSTDGLEGLFAGLHGQEGLLEGYVSFLKEFSVIGARDAKGTIVFWDPFENIHVNHILDLSFTPAFLDNKLVVEARSITEKIMNALDVKGLLTVEFFLGDRNNLMVNELAPRPHNSGHITLESSATSQFHQLARILGGLDLGPVHTKSAGAMANILGDHYPSGRALPWGSLNQFPGVQVHDYLKKEARAGRKMAHLSVLETTVEKAQETIIEARKFLMTSS